MIVYKIVRSFLYVALIALCVSVPLSASAGVGAESNTTIPADLSNSMMPIMTDPGSEIQATADSRAVVPSYPAPSFKADMVLAQNSGAYMSNTTSPSYVDTPNMMYPQQYTSPQYTMPLGTDQYSQYNGSTAVPPYPYQGNQPYMQGTAPDAMMPYQGNQPYMQQGVVPDAMMPYTQQQQGQQGMYPQMPGMGMQPQYVSVEQLYNQAMQSYRNRDYQGAMRGFQEVAMRFSRSDLADNAHYWIGEIYYGTKNYPAAIQSFQTVMQMYPQGNKVPDAMLKMGFAYADIGQQNIARSILNDVSMRFSDNARIRNLAVKKLNALNNLY